MGKDNPFMAWKGAAENQRSPVGTIESSPAIHGVETVGGKPAESRNDD